MHKATNVISFFSGALGLDLGLEKAGFTICGLAECNRFAVDTIELNRQLLRQANPVIFTKALSDGNIEHACKALSSEPLRLGAELDILAGAPPCQPFSTAGKRLSLKDARASGFDLMFQAIEILRPKYFVVENVRGVLSAASTHRPLAQRGPGFPPLKTTEEYGSAFKRILADLKSLCAKTGYCATWGVLNAADYGVPQRRERFVIIGSRSGLSIWPKATHAAEASEGLRPWKSIRQAFADIDNAKLVFQQFSEADLTYLRRIPEGSNWRSLPSKLQAKAIGGAYDSWGGRSGFLRRLAWDEPSPTITNNPKARATMLCHPTEDRPLSIQECACLQGFPPEWRFGGGGSVQFRQIGNATPVGLGEAIGNAIRHSIEDLCSPSYAGEVFCAQPELINRINNRPRTKLNPAKMRGNSGREEDLVWLGRAAARRTDARRYKVRPETSFVA